MIKFKSSINDLFKYYVKLKKLEVLMKKIKIMFFIILFFCFIGCFCFVEANSLDTLGNGYNSGNVQTGNTTSEATNNIKTSINKVFGIFFTFMQVASVASIVFVGVSYMFASAENKAALKQKIVPLIVGIIIVFGATTVVSFVTKIFTEVAI